MSHLTENELATLVSHLTEKWSFWKGRRADKAAEYLKELEKTDRELQKRLNEYLKELEKTDRELQKRLK